MGFRLTLLTTLLVTGCGEPELAQPIPEQPQPDLLQPAPPDLELAPPPGPLSTGGPHTCKLSPTQSAWDLYVSVIDDKGALIPGATVEVRAIADDSLVTSKVAVQGTVYVPLQSSGKPLPAYVRVTAPGY